MLDLKQKEHDPRGDEIDPQSQCEHCNGPVTVGEAKALGICSDCYWMEIGERDE